MKTVDEIMELVRKYGDRRADGKDYGCCNGYDILMEFITEALTPKPSKTVDEIMGMVRTYKHLLIMSPIDKENEIRAAIQAALDELTAKIDFLVAENTTAREEIAVRDRALEILKEEHSKALIPACNAIIKAREELKEKP